MNDGISTDISPALKPGVSMLGLFAAVDPAQVVRILGGSLLFALQFFPGCSL